MSAHVNAGARACEFVAASHPQLHSHSHPHSHLHSILYLGDVLRFVLLVKRDELGCQHLLTFHVVEHCMYRTECMYSYIIPAINTSACIHTSFQQSTWQWCETQVDRQSSSQAKQYIAQTDDKLKQGINLT